MKIVFNLIDVGLADNGGTKTLVKCAETFVSFGHRVTMVSNFRNSYRWQRISSTVQFVRCSSVPDCDLVIATGFLSVPTTVRAKSRYKCYYIRGFELWRATKKALLRSYKSLPCIVNSQWLLSLLKIYKINVNLVYPGLDFDNFVNLKSQRDNNVGAIFSKKHKTKLHVFAQNVARSTGYSLLMLNKDNTGRTPDEVNKFYNQIKVWVSPSELEGLHNCPMEASLAGCGLVVTDHPRSGTQDYSIHEKTALVYPAGDIKTASEYVRLLITNDTLRKNMNESMVEVLREKIGDRKSNMKRFIEISTGSKNA